MKRIYVLFSLLFAIYILSAFFWPLPITTLSDYFNAFNSLSVKNFSSKNFCESENKICYSLSNNDMLSTTRYLIPLFKGVDYQIIVDTKADFKDDNTLLIFSANNKKLFELPITNINWNTYKKTFSVKEDIYGFGRGVPDLNIKCKCENGNRVFLARFSISCSPFFKTFLKKTTRLFKKDNISEKQNDSNKVQDSILNGKFESGLDKWQYNSDTVLTNFRQTNFAYIRNNGKQRSVLSQNVNLISGAVYYLSFDLKSSAPGAYVNLRNLSSGLEQYFWCKTSGEKNYLWGFVPDMSGSHSIIFTTDTHGDFYYSNISLIKVNLLKRYFYEFLVILLFLILLVVFYFINVYVYKYSRD